MDKNNLPTPTRETSSILEIPPRPIGPIAAQAVQDIDHALDELKRYGVKAKDGSRLHQARRILDEAARNRVLVPAHRGDTLGLRALELAFDFAAIAGSLPSERIADVRRELEASLVGPLQPPEEDRGALQLQSQFVVRAAFVRSGTAPSHPRRTADGRKLPDLLLENGVSEYGVEAKRPQFTRNIIPRLNDGRDQLHNYGVRGAILVDVTDCVRGMTPRAVDDAVREHSLRIYDEIFVTGVGYRPGYSSIMVAGAYARLAWTSEDSEDHSIVAVHTSSTIGLFATQQYSLLDHRAQWLRASFQDGLSTLSRTLAEHIKAAGDVPRGATGP